MSKNKSVANAVESARKGDVRGLRKSIHEALVEKIRKALQKKEQEIAKSYLGEAVCIGEDNKAAFGTASGKSYAIKLDSLSDNNFMTKSFGQQIDSIKSTREFQKTAKSDHVGAKGKSTMAAVKQWVKDNSPKQFYAVWQMDSSSYKDDSVEIFYTK